MSDTMKMDELTEATAVKIADNAVFKLRSDLIRVVEGVILNTYENPLGSMAVGLQEKLVEAAEMCRPLLEAQARNTVSRRLVNLLYKGVVDEPST